MPSTFFTKLTTTSLWKSAVGVSNAGLRRGRGKGAGRAQVKDFNRGQEIGLGRRKLILPGLNAPVSAGKKYTEIQDAGNNMEFEEKLNLVRKDLNVYKKFRENPLDRGWSGRKAHGRIAGPPDDYNETSFEGFNSTVLMLRSIQIMTGLLGRTKVMHAFVVTGNGNGLAGFGTAHGNDPKSCVRLARNKAGQSLIRVPRWEDHTVMHDFFSRYYSTTVFVERKPKGHGIKAHRAIEACCDAFGIKDLYAKVEGSSNNVINITKAFFLGLMNQKSYEDIAEEKRLHLVDVREENFFYPQVLASPESPIKTDSDLGKTTENIDFTYYIYNGKIKSVPAPRRNPFTEHPKWYKHLDRLDYGKNRERTKLLLAARYGDKKVKDVFPYFRSTAKSFYRTEEVE